MIYVCVSAYLERPNSSWLRSVAGYIGLSKTEKRPGLTEEFNVCVRSISRFAAGSLRFDESFIDTRKDQTRRSHLRCGRRRFAATASPVTTPREGSPFVTAMPGKTDWITS